MIRRQEDNKTPMSLDAGGKRSVRDFLSCFASLHFFWCVLAVFLSPHPRPYFDSAVTWTGDVGHGEANRGTFCKRRLDRQPRQGKQEKGESPTRPLALDTFQSFH